jgi:hypothetical protein
MPRINRPTTTGRIQNVRDIQNANRTTGPAATDQGSNGANQSPDALDANASNTSLRDLTPAHNGAVTLGSTAALGGHGLTAPGDAQNVVNKSLARSLRVTLRACEKHFEYAGESRRPDNAYPRILKGRREVWDGVDRITKSHLNRESPELQEAVGALKEFTQHWGYGGDERNMPRKWNGKMSRDANGDPIRLPGLKELLGDVFKAAGMGEVNVRPRPWS